MQHGKPAATQDHSLDPDDEIKQEAVRWLDRDLVTPGAVRQEIERNADRSIAEARLVVDREVSTGATFVAARIRGIDRLNVIARWLEVEHRLDRGPRERIVEMLENRADWLKTHGERDERATGERTSAPEKTVEWDTEDGTRPTMANVGDRHRSRSDVATDGGES